MKCCTTICMFLRLVILRRFLSRCGRTWLQIGFAKPGWLGGTQRLRFGCFSIQWYSGRPALAIAIHCCYSQYWWLRHRYPEAESWYFEQTVCFVKLHAPTKRAVQYRTLWDSSSLYKLTQLAKYSEEKRTPPNWSQPGASYCSDLGASVLNIWLPVFYLSIFHRKQKVWW